MIEVREAVVNDKVEITVVFDQADYDFFALDKGEPKEWIRNCAAANNASREKMLKREIAEKSTVTAEAFAAKVAGLKKAKEDALKLK